MIEIIEVLKKFDIFSGFNYNELSFIEKYSVLKQYKKDEIIITPQDIRKELYIILSGKIISTFKPPAGAERKNGEYYPGDFFGGISLFGNKPHFDTFYAEEESFIFIIKEKEFTTLIESESSIATTFISNLLSLTIQQLRKSSQFLADIVQWGENASRRVITDELTGIYNRLFLDDVLESFFNISKSNNKPLSLLMIDIDNCRVINEILGHDTGNLIISKFVNIINSIISKYGIIARYGGDEFSILLPEADLEKAKAIAEQIRKEVEAYDFSQYMSGKKIAVTTSIGISSFPETATDINAFKEKADSSLYKAKELGKNKVACIE